MNQPGLVIQSPEKPDFSEEQTAVREEPAFSTGTLVRELGQQSNRSPEQQAEVERISQIEPFSGLDRDEVLFTHLNHWCDLSICARVMTMDRLGLAKSLIFYTRSHTKRSSGLLLTPASVAYIELEQHGGPTDLFLLILEFLVNPLDCGNLRQMRSRTWGTLKAYKVKILIINNAELLSLKALYELMRINEKLKISVVLVGSPYLDEILDPRTVRKKNFIYVYNTFLKFHSYSTLNKEDYSSVIEEWEKELSWSQPLNLWSDEDVVKTLWDKSQGQLRVLYECLQEIAVWKLDHPRAQINFKNILQAIGIGHQPMSKP